MASRIFLHVGAPKSGSTFLQGKLNANRAGLRSAGFLFPERPVDHFRFMLHVLGRLDDVPRPKAAYTAFDRITARVHTWQSDVVISNELLAGATSDQIASLLDRLAPAEVHVIYTVRDLSRTLCAEWQQALKGGARLTLDEFVDGVIELCDAAPRRVPNVIGESEVIEKFWVLHGVTDVLRRWSEHLPADRVHVVTLPPAGEDLGLLWHRFSKVLGLDPTVAGRSPQRANESLGVVQAEVMRHVNSALATQHSHDRSMREFVRHRFVIPTVMPTGPRTKIGLHGSHFTWAGEQASKIVAALRQEECDIVGDLNDLFPGSPPPGAVHPDDVASEEVASMATQLLATVLIELHATRSPAK